MLDVMDAVGMTASFPWTPLSAVAWRGDSLIFVLFSESFYLHFNALPLQLMCLNKKIQAWGLKLLLKATVHWTILALYFHKQQGPFKLGQW